jgi:hypothetical protein
MARRGKRGRRRRGGGGGGAAGEPPVETGFRGFGGGASGGAGYGGSWEPERMEPIRPINFDIGRFKPRSTIPSGRLRGR